VKTILCFLLFPLVLAAQSARWEPPGGVLAAGQATSLQLIFDGCEPTDTPVPPKVAALSLAFAGQSSNMSLINGTYSHTISYNYAALLLQKQSVQIPAFDVATNKGTVRVPAAHFDSTDAMVNGSQPLSTAARSRLQASPTEVWAGEVFHLAYSIEAARGYYPDFEHGVFDWNADPLLAEDWSQPEQFDIRTGAEPATGLNYHTRALVHKPGSYHLNPVNQLVNLSVGVTGFGFFQQRQYQQFSVASDTPTIDVRPLPPAPAGFTGAVGSFKLVSKVVPERAAVGEPITWTLELSGTGNWPDIAGLPPREVSRDFQVIAPTAKRAPVEKKLFDAKLTEDVVLMPTRPGTYPLRPVTFSYFDPESGTYKVVSTPAATVTIAAAAPVPGAPPATSGTAAAPENSGGTEIETPSAPSGLPRDPLPDSGLATAPFTRGTVAALVFAPIALLLLGWFGLALQRAAATDPARFRRAARLRLAATLDKLGGLSVEGPANPAELVAWQQDAAILWNIPSAAPNGGALADPAWATLWTESERAIFGPSPRLPVDWVARARIALAAAPAPAFARFRAFRAGNLFPFLVAALALIGSYGVVRAATARAAAAPSAYRRADFAAAEGGWRERLAAEPLDWAARHNLSLALAQQSRWDEAAAQAAAAFVQQPSADAVRWQFALASGKAGFAPEALADFLSPGLRPQLARLASPSGWQMVLIVSAWGAALALGIKLARSYGHLPGRWIGLAAGAVLTLAIALILTAAIGWSSYGAAADTEAAEVWRATTLRSIPTEADAAQKTTPLSAGTLARTDRTFLGWIRLRFDNGQTGWVRREEVVWLWK